MLAIMILVIVISSSLIYVIGFPNSHKRLILGSSLRALDTLGI